MRPLKLTVVVVTAVATALGQGHAQLMDEFFLDLKAGSATSQISLPSQTTFRVEVLGTGSAWRAGQWNNGVCKGVPEAAPMYVTAGVANGKVGMDPEFVFAVAAGSSLCSKPGPVPFPVSNLQFNTGLLWTEAAAIDRTFSLGHVYQYLVVGSGNPLGVRWIDTFYPDNYGQYRIRIYPGS